MDKLVQAVHHRGIVLLFMESGKIYKMTISNYNKMTINSYPNKTEFKLIGEIPNG